MRNGPIPLEVGKLRVRLRETFSRLGTGLSSTTASIGRGGAWFGGMAIDLRRRLDGLSASETVSLAPADQPSIRKPLLLGVSAIGIFFGGFGAWAAFTPLSSAAFGPGQVRAESQRKTVQHLEGGIIRQILVKEGDHITERQVVARLDDTQSSAKLGLLRSQSDALRALDARLVAERDGASVVVYPLDLGLRRSDRRVAETLAGQDRIFVSRRKSLQDQVDVLEQRISQVEAEISSYRAQTTSAENQIRFVAEELDVVRDLYQRGLEKKPRLLALEKQRAQLEGYKGQQLGLIARAEQTIGETRLQIVGLRNAAVKDVTAELRDAQTQLAELDDKLRAAIDVQERTEIVAPQAGRVVKLRHFTSGGVLKPGEALLDVVPQHDKLIIDARVAPIDIDTVHPGLDAEIKLSAFKQRSLPVIIGKVLSVSADALSDDRTGQSFYVAQIELDAAELGRLKDVQLYSGMTAEVFILTGSRTALRYLLDPLFDSFRKAFRED